MIHIQIRQQRLDAADAVTFTPLKLGYGPASRGIRHVDVEGQTALIRYAQHQ